MTAKYYTAGYTPPAGVDNREKVKSIQSLLGVEADGVWGAKTQAAFEKAYSGTAVQGGNTGTVPAAATGKYSGASYISGGGAAGTPAFRYSVPQKISGAAVKNAAYATVSQDTAAIREMQRALSYYAPEVSVTGVYDKATADAFEKYGNRALYSAKRTDGNGNAIVSYGTVQSGNAVSPWQTEEQRRNANNAHLARYGLNGEEVYPLYDTAGNRLDYGSMGHDGMGGVYDPEGYSSNPYFLMANAGVSRGQLTGAAAQASDKSIKMALEIDPALLGRDLYVTNGGGVSAAYTPGSISVNAIRNEIASLRGIAATEKLGMGTVAAEIPKPEYYAPSVSAGDTTDTMDTYTQLYNTLAGVGVSGADTDVSGADTGVSGGQDMFSYYYDKIIGKLNSILPSDVNAAYSADELSAQYSAYLRPRVDSAIAAREKAAQSNQAELDADAAARGMGSSTFVSSLKNREMDAAASDIAGLESDYLATLAERVQEGMLAQMERQQELYLFQAQQQASAQKTALELASDWYFDYMDRQQELEEAKIAATGKSTKSYGTGGKSGYSGTVLTLADYEAFVDLLNSEEREKLRNSNDKKWSAYREEMTYALGREGLEMLLKNAK